MFVAVYEFRVKKGCIDSFRKAWLETTRCIYEEDGSLGSRLHESKDSHFFLGYAQWPDRETWQTSGQNPSSQYQAAFARMKECLADSETRYELQVSDDLLQGSQFHED